MDTARQEAKKQSKGEVLASNSHRATKHKSGLRHRTGAGMLVVLGLAVSFSSQLTRDQVTALQPQEASAEQGDMFIGYSIGRRKAQMKNIRT